jgi:Asp-tRNA(Asn)/Glu-tRNA(Gln) amidotransferase A subunit family amidase
MKNIFLENDLFEINRKLVERIISYKDIVDQTIKAISANESLLHAWNEYDLEMLLEQSLHFDSNFNPEESNVLKGIPFGVKDIFNTKNFKTEMGSVIWKGFHPGNNARCLDSLLNKSALLVGKTVTAEFAVHKLNETVNPHDFRKTPGTSSSGSAVAVASGMVPITLGSQTAGSIVRPASFCGIWGMKPTFGLIPRTGVLKTTDSLDTIGFFSTHGKNLRPILDTIRVKGPNYPFVYKLIDSKQYKIQENTLKKVALVKTNKWEVALEYTKKAIENLGIKISELDNYEVEILDLSNILKDAHEIHSIIYSKSLSYYFKQEVSNYNFSISPVMLEMIEQGERIEYSKFANALNLQEKLITKLDEILGNYDIAISIGTSSSAPDRDVTEIDDPSLIWTLCHIPSISIPYSTCPNKLPFGLQIIGKRYSDYKLISILEDLINKNVIQNGSNKIINTELNLI